ncbi:ABC transporter substrate-binding protein [Enterococcus alcedinis]|uniref:ABC transporter substrate-binding protein n=1 Tax=Enterococcus alcedinis TaxID=1274384 RepID=A0A917JG29_9ENTE|nr:sugar ABC transporter substrate-binding protein [Enterococcus alcedinis]MBP2101899.1 multiple sugar transport system substrate-binding protein [Enterococcus alcedinis]GGI65462.1 ABC transporter substrate-binding protein [Enterococcus alcedinis]
MKRKQFALMSTVLLTGLFIAGCSGGGSAKDDGKTNIRFSTWDSEKDLEDQQKLVDQFNESQDEIKVTLEAYGSEYDTKISAGIGAGDAPDVMYMWNFPHYKDALEPLDTLIEKEGPEYKDNFYETLWNYNSMDEQVYGIPIGFTTHAVFYNKDLFDQYNVPYPEKGWTWDDLEAKAEQLTNKENGDTGFALPGKPDPYDFEMFAWGNNGSFTNADGKLAGSIDSKETVEVFDDFQAMLKNESAIATEGSGTTEMESGKVGMYVYGSWGLQPLKDAGINYGLAEVPSRNGHEGVSILSSSGLSISKDSKNKEAAFEFVKYWTNEAANEYRMEYELPVLKSVVEKHQLEQDEYKGVFYEMLEKSSDFTPSSFKAENWSDISSDLSLSFERVFNPSTLEKPEKVFKEVADNYQK